jgi:hypothetical protein
MTDTTVLALRSATPDDTGVLRDLAQLDSARPLAAPAILAIVDGEAVAAASLVDDHVVADPFVPTEAVVAVLRARVAALAA